jgi:hypothetical protein
VRVLGLLLLPVAFAFAVIFIAAHVVPVHAPSVAQPPTGTVWAGRVFVNKAELARWLRSKGASYQVWAERHPPPRAQPEKPQAASKERGVQNTLSRVAGSNVGQDVLLGGALVLLVGMLAMLYRRLPLRVRGDAPARPRASTSRLPRGFGSSMSPVVGRPLHMMRLGERRKAARLLADLPGSAARVTRGLGPRASGSINGTVQTLRYAHWTVQQALHRRAEVGWCIAATCLAVTVVVLLPHL